MAFTPKDWKDYPDTSTPITAAALEDMETRVTDYADTAIAARVVNVKDYGATGDGTTDDYDAIVDAYESLPTSGGYRWGTVTFPDGVYRCDSTLTFSDAGGVVFQGIGGNPSRPILLTKSSGSSPLISITKCVGLDFRDLLFCYDHSSYSGNLVSAVASGIDIMHLWFNNCYFGGLSTNLGTFTVTLASPGVFTLSGNTLANGNRVVLSTTGALPTGLTAGKTYYVVNNGTDGTGKFRLAATSGGTAINTSGSQSGTHSLTRVASDAAGCIYLENVIISGFKRCKFENALKGIRCAASGGKYTTTITVNDRCEFARLDDAAIYNPYFSWVIDGNVFEPNAAGAAAGIISAKDYTTTGITIQGNYFGDVTSGSGYYIDLRPSGATISGNYMDVLSGGESTTPIRIQDSYGTVILGNHIVGPATMPYAVKLAKVAGSGAVGLAVIGNYTNAVDPLYPTSSWWNQIASGMVIGNGSSGTNDWPEFLAPDNTSGRYEFSNGSLKLDGETSSTNAPTTAVFVDSADHKLKYRDNLGTVHDLY